MSDAPAVASPETAPVLPADAAPSSAGEAIRSARVVSAVTLLSRVAGLLRDMAVAALFGASWVWDAFVLAFMVPNLFRRLFGEGSLSAAFVPVYTELRERDGTRRALRLLATTLTVVTLGTAAIAALLVAAALLLPDGAWGFAFGADEADKLRLFRMLLPALMPFVVVICATALLGGALNVHGRFFVPAFAPVLLNIAWIGGVGLAVAVADGRPERQALIVAASIVVGAALGFAHHLLAVRAALRADDPDARLTASVHRGDPALGTVFQRMGPTMLGLGLLQISVLLDNVIAEAFVSGDGAVSALYYGNRLMQFPLALIGTAMGIAVFPLLARHVARGEGAAFHRALDDCLRITLFLAIPASVGLVILRDPIVEVLFRRGAFAGEAQARTAAVVGFYAIGVAAACVRMLQTRAFFALGDTATPVRVSVWVMGLNLAGNIVLVQTPLQEAGLALSTAATTTLSAIVMGRMLRRHRGGDAVDHAATRTALRQSVARSVMAAGAMASVAWALGSAVGGPGEWMKLATIPKFALLAGVVVASALAFAVVARLLRATELRELFRRG